jgi:hypothetical protein
MSGASIRIFLPTGSPEGLKIVRKSNWTGVIAVTPRSSYLDVRSREEFNSPCVYVLSGPAEADNVLPRIYVGEGDQARSRLDSHIKSKDYWTEAAVVTASDGGLNKAITRHMESRLISLAQKANRSELENGNAPQTPPLSEADLADAEAFLAEMRSILPLLRIDAFEIAQSTPARDSQALFVSGPEAKGEGSDSADGFLVKAGAMARATTVPSIHAYLVQLREKLIERGILVAEPGGLRLAQDYLFNSPSTAAGVILGRNANGRIEWKDAQGRTLKDLEVTQLPPEQATD